MQNLYRLKKGNKLITSYIRGWRIIFSKNKWIFEDTGKDIVHNRKCIHCGEYPTKEGHDFCLRNIDNIEHACCGHGVSSFYIKYKRG